MTDDEIRDVVDQALSYEPTGALHEAKRCRHSACEWQTVRRAWMYARSMLTLPDVVTVGFVDEPSAVRAAVRLDGSGKYSIRLNLAHLRSPGPLAECVFHELRHVHDFHAGARLAKAELERNAIEFAAMAMRRFPF